MNRAPVLLAALLLLAPAALANEGEPVQVDFELDPFDLSGPTFRAFGGELHLGGRLAGDFVRYGRNHRRRSGPELQDARLSLTGRWREFSFRVDADLRGVNTPRHLYEAWAAVELWPELTVTLGQFRVALSSEYATREEDLPFFSYGFTPFIDGRHDVGVKASGDLFSGMIHYEALAVSGHGFGLDGHRRTSPLMGLRLVFHPFAGRAEEEPGPPAFLGGLFFGIGYASLRDFDDPVIVETPVNSRIFQTGDLDGDSGSFLHWELGWHCGWFRIWLERLEGAAEEVPVGAGAVEDIDQLVSYSIGASVNLTGESHVWRGGRWVAPDPGTRTPGGNGLPGRWELAARYSNADLDRKLFEHGFTTHDRSSQETRTFTLFLSWWPTPRTRLGLGWVKTIADDRLNVFGGRNRDSSFVFWLEHLF